MQVQGKFNNRADCSVEKCLAILLLGRRNFFPERDFIVKCCSSLFLFRHDLRSGNVNASRDLTSDVLILTHCIEQDCQNWACKSVWINVLRSLLRFPTIQIFLLNTWRLCVEWIESRMFPEALYVVLWLPESRSDPLLWPDHPSADSILHTCIYILRSGGSAPLLSWLSPLSKIYKREVREIAVNSRQEGTLGNINRCLETDWISHSIFGKYYRSRSSRIQHHLLIVTGNKVGSRDSFSAVWWRNS